MLYCLLNGIRLTVYGSFGVKLSRRWRFFSLFCYVALREFMDFEVVNMSFIPELLEFVFYVNKSLIFFLQCLEAILSFL